MNIEKENGQLIIDKIKEICYLTSDVNKNIVKMYQNIEEMRKGWYGNAYDKFAKLANNYIESLNKYFEVILVQVPTELITKMQEYMKDNLLNIELDEIVLIENINMTNRGTSLRFMTNIIEEYKLEIERIFLNINSKCNEILIKNQMIEWYDIDELDCKQEIEGTIKNIQLIIFKIINSLKKIISNQRSEIDKIENLKGMENIAEKITEDMADDVQTKNKLIEEQFSELYLNLKNKLWDKR